MGATVDLNAEPEIHRKQSKASMLEFKTVNVEACCFMNFCHGKTNNEFPFGMCSKSLTLTYHNFEGVEMYSIIYIPIKYSELSCLLKYVHVSAEIRCHQMEKSGLCFKMSVIYTTGCF